MFFKHVSLSRAFFEEERRGWRWIWNRKKKEKRKEFSWSTRHRDQDLWIGRVVSQELLPMLFRYLPIRWSHEAVTTESRTGKSEIGGQADWNHDGPSSINDPPPIHRSGITIFDVINPGSSLPCSQFYPWSCDLIWKGKKKRKKKMKREKWTRGVSFDCPREREKEREEYFKAGNIIIDFSSMHFCCMWISIFSFFFLFQKRFG